MILATNKIETLDPALIRPGRIDRKIEFPAPDQKTRRHIFQIHTSKMNLADDVDLEEFVMSKDEVNISAPSSRLDSCLPCFVNRNRSCSADHVQMFVHLLISFAVVVLFFSFLGPTLRLCALNLACSLFVSDA